MRRAASPAPPRPATAGSRRPTAAPCSSTNWRPCRRRPRTGCCARSNMARSPGSARPSRSQVDVRIVAATNEHLPRLVDEGRFRADLLDRLSFEVVTLPPLRARARATSRCSPSISGGAWRSSWTGPIGPAFRTRALAELEAYAWPGNVRELRNVVERAVYRAEDPEREIDAIQFDPFASPWVLSRRPGGRSRGRGVRRAAHSRARRTRRAGARRPPTDDLRGAVNAYEKALLEEALGAHRYNQRATAAALGLSYDQLRHAMKRHQLALTSPG